MPRAITNENVRVEQMHTQHLIKIKPKEYQVSNNLILNYWLGVRLGAGFEFIGFTLYLSRLGLFLLALFRPRPEFTHLKPPLRFVHSWFIKVYSLQVCGWILKASKKDVYFK